MLENAIHTVIESIETAPAVSLSVQMIGATIPVQSNLGFASQCIYFKKIREYSSEAISDCFAQLFQRITLLVGYRGSIDELQKGEIKNAILRHFSSLSFEEIYKAFQLDRSNQLAGDEQKIRTVTEHYQFFDVSYVTSVLVKYQHWLRQLQRDHHLPIAPEKSAPQLPKHSYDAEVEAYMIQTFEDFKATNQLPTLCSFVYNWWGKQGVLKPFLNALSKRKLQQFREETAQVLRQRVQKDSSWSVAYKTFLSQGDVDYQDSGNKPLTDALRKILSVKKEVLLRAFYQWKIENNT